MPCQRYTVWARDQLGKVRELVMRLFRVWAAVLALALGYPLPAAAVEYKLRVANLHEDAFYALLGTIGTRHEGPVQNSRLITALDTGEAPAGVLLYDRPLEAARNAVATAFGAVRVRPTLPQDGDSNSRWSEVRWEGKPGEQSVWVIDASRTRQTEVRDVALAGTRRLVRVIPHLRAPSQAPTMALSMWLGSIQEREGNAALWNQYLSTALDLSDGVAVIVGVNSSSGFADRVYIVVKHESSPATYSVVLAWRKRPHETQAGGDRNTGIIP